MTATHAITLIAAAERMPDLTAVEAVVVRHRVHIESRRVVPVPRSLGAVRAVETWILDGLEGDEAMAAMNREMRALEVPVDRVLQTLAVRHAHYQLAVFDMDSTLIRCESIDELAALHGVGEQVAAITERAMRGELDFDASFAERLAMLRGLDGQVATDIAAQLPVTEGAAELMVTLRARGVETAILSGGFDIFACALQNQLGIDHIVANTLEIEAGALTGRVVPPIVNGQHKADMLQRLLDARGLQANQAIAVGDGANDLPMLAKAGLGVAFHAKPRVQDAAQYAVNVGGLDSIAYLLGAPGEAE